MRIQLVLSLLLLLSVCSYGDDPAGNKAAPTDNKSEDSGQADGSDEEADSGSEKAPKFELSDEVRDVLLPLFKSIAEADASRATVEMLADSLAGGTVVDSQNSTYQIASAYPDKFTVYLKEPEQRTRVYCDGEEMVVAVAPDAFFRSPEALNTQQAVTSLPVPLGPYPEPVLALTLAGADPAISLVGGMKSIEIVDRKDFRGDVPAIHLRGVQADEVKWDFWMSTKEPPKPLRLLVDLTPMLMNSDELQFPAGFSYQLRFDFLSWRVTGDVDENLFVYTPPKDATEHESLEDYYASIAGVVGEHPLIGKPAPPFETETLDGKKISLKKLKDKVVVLDFWATWCAPCLAALPVLKQVTDEFADKDVVLLAVNTGEEKEEISEFLEEHKLDVEVVLDPEGEIADAFVADAIPQTIVIGKTGEIESVHVGFLGEEALKERLSDELEVLSIGGRIGSIPAESAEQEPADSEQTKTDATESAE